jgi:hypothetical protein
MSIFSFEQENKEYYQTKFCYFETFNFVMYLCLHQHDYLHFGLLF